jgi:hypothetical protein
MLSGLALVFHLAPRPALFTLWASWLSLAQACRPWLDYQWDMLLVETAFTSLFFAPSGLRPKLSTEAEPSPIARLLMALLACKVTLESGLVKLFGGDPTWRELTALVFHWWTQPLPTWGAVLADRLPLAAQMTLCALLLVLEVVASLLALGPRPARLISAGGLVALQLGFAFTGNFAFSPLLSVTLAVPLLDDRALRVLTLGRLSVPQPVAPSRARWYEGAGAGAVVLLSLVRFAPRLATTLPPWAGSVIEVVRPFETINGYGAFAVMTKTRPEVIIEGRDEGDRWRRYELPYKPGALDRRPAFVAPLHPRLDWQLWFAALGRCDDSPWVASLERHLLSGTPEVLALFESNPFPGGRPRALRTMRHEFRFAPASAEGLWWTATEKGPFCPPVTLGLDGGLLEGQAP